MPLRIFSDKNRPVHLGPYPLERLARADSADFADVPAFEPLSFVRPDEPLNLVNAMDEYQSMMDVIRDGFTNDTRSSIPADLRERANHLKAFAYFQDAAMAGIGRLPEAALLRKPVRNPGIEHLAEALRTRQTKTLASGIDMIMADLKESMEAPPASIDHHTHTLVIVNEMARDVRAGETGTGWLRDCARHAAAMRAAETAVVIANYIRLLGWDAVAHTASTTDIDINIAAVAAGIATADNGELWVPYLGNRFACAVVTTTLDMAVDKPLKSQAQQPWLHTRGPAWWFGAGVRKSALNNDPYLKRDFYQGPHPFESLKRVTQPTTYIDEANVARVPKRTDMFARAQFGDMGKSLQEGAKGGHYARKAAPSMAQRRMLGAFVLLQDGTPQDAVRPTDEKENAASIKAASYFLGVDAVGLSRCPDWTWYSHDATGEPLQPPHDQAISMIIDQGYETMEGASGDDWISVAQSMRAYLRFSLLGGVIAKQIRNLGYKAKAHTVLDGEVLQPPLLLLAGLGEVSRIGEVILNPFLGPRLKSGVVTTDMPLAHDQPIDFGLQRFCESCNKCARECPSGAITAGPKLMFNGYEIWKSDSQKCATYRITTEGGAMCGRCMKTCPWNLEGIFKERPFRWAAMNLPATAPALAKLDDVAGNGGLNPVKKWWWDLELDSEGGYHPATQAVNARDLQRDLHLKYEDQTLAVYPAPLAPHPYPYPFPMDREAGIEAYQAMITAEEYRTRLERGDDTAIHRYSADGVSPVLRVVVSKAQAMGGGITLFELRDIDGGNLPPWEAGAHLDVVVAPEFLRQYSMSGNPADQSFYQIAVLREEDGRGGSKLMHRIFSEGRKVFISRPINHFPLDERADNSILMGGGIGITPMIAMAHRLHSIGVDFELHYSVSTRAVAAFADDIASFDWADRVTLHVTDEGSRAVLEELIADYRSGSHVYICGSERYMNAVMTAAATAGYPEEACHLEYFSVPEVPDYINHDFTLRLAKSGREFLIPADKTVTDVLAENGFQIDVKCSDGICGVCKCTLVDGEVEHRDFVLSKAQRKTSVILCQSRAVHENAVVTVDL
jgi:reductive dehalogenase